MAAGHKRKRGIGQPLREALRAGGGDEHVVEQHAEVRLIHSELSRPVTRAPIAKANGTVSSV